MEQGLAAGILKLFLAVITTALTILIWFLRHGD
jgi:hypothetical protein